MASPRSGVAGAIGFILATCALLWLTHAVAFFSHEYSHSFVAWALGWKTNPWVIDFGHLDAANLFMMIEMDEKVDYAPIFASSRGPEAAAIAAAGVVIGNGLLFVICQGLFRAAVRAGQRWTSLLLYWLCVMCVGNFLAYVPMRTFTNVYDMGTIQRGLNVSPWIVLLVLGLPFAVGVWCLFVRLLPSLVENVLTDTFERTVVVVLTPFIVFFFYGSAGWEPAFHAVSKTLALVSMALVFPFASVVLWLTLVKSRAVSRDNMRAAAS